MVLQLLTDRFWAKVKKQEGCWPWQASVNKKGYGNFKVDGVCLPSSRVAFELVKGSIPEGLHVLHTCHNPSCCNPAHLYAGTNAENQRDKAEASRGPKRRLSVGLVRSIRQELATGAYPATVGLHHNVSRATVNLIKTGEYDGTTAQNR